MSSDDECPASPTVVIPATVIAGRYRLVRPLGSGGAADVWLGFDDTSGDRVAVKLPRRERSSLAPGPSLVRRELAAGQRLVHPNIVQVLDGGEDDGEPFLVLEYVDGPTLRHALETRGPLPPAEVTRIGAELSGALAYAHAAGVLHNDIKPENILLSPEGAKLADFGAAGGLATTLTVTAGASFAGTVAYLAPELLEGEAASPASDQYSLGLVLFEAAAGRQPWTGATPAIVAGQRLATPAPALTDVLPGAPHRLTIALQSALHRKPLERFRSAGAFGEALVASSNPTVALSLPLVSRRPNPLRGRGYGHRRAFAAVALVGLLGAASALAFAGNGSGGDPGAEEPESAAAREANAAAPSTSVPTPTATAIPPTATAAPPTATAAPPTPTVAPPPTQQVIPVQPDPRDRDQGNRPDKPRGQDRGDDDDDDDD